MLIRELLLAILCQKQHRSQKKIQKEGHPHGHCHFFQTTNFSLDIQLLIIKSAQGTYQNHVFAFFKHNTTQNTSSTTTTNDVSSTDDELMMIMIVIILHISLKYEVRVCDRLVVVVVVILLLFSVKITKTYTFTS